MTTGQHAVEARVWRREWEMEVEAAGISTDLELKVQRQQGCEFQASLATATLSKQKRHAMNPSNKRTGKGGEMDWGWVGVKSTCSASLKS